MTNYGNKRKEAVLAASKVHFALRGASLKPPSRRRISSYKDTQSTSALITLVHGEDDVFVEEDKGIKSTDEKAKEKPIKIWRKWARVVKLMAGVCSALRRYSTHGYIDLENMNVDIPTKRKLGITQDEEGNIEEVSFNPRDFKKKQELTWPDHAKEMVSKLPHERSETDVSAIASLMRGLHSFRKYTGKMQTLLCRVVRYCSFNKKRVIVRKGHVGHSFYFIFSGAVSVVFDKDSDSIFVRPEVSILRKGECFGEIALLKNTTRNASIVCFEETELLAVDREDFMEHGLYDVMMKELEHRKNYLQSLDLFSTWPSDSIEDLCFVSRIEEYRYNKLIVESTKVNEWLYFVSKGGCDVLRLVDLTRCPEFEQFVPKSLHPTPFNGLKQVILDMESSVSFLRNNAWDQVAKEATADDKEEADQQAVRITRPEQLKKHLQDAVKKVMMAKASITSLKAVTAGATRIAATSAASSEGSPDKPTTGDTENSETPRQRRIGITEPVTSELRRCWSAGRKSSSRRKSSDHDLSFSVLAMQVHKSQTPTDDNQSETSTSTQSRPTSRPRVSLYNSNPEPYESVSKLLPPNVRPSAKSKKRSVSTEPFMLDDSESEDYVGIGVYVKLNHLIPGNVFGISSLLEHDTRCCLVSKGSEVIRVPMSKFIALSDQATKEKLKKMEPVYPLDRNLCSTFLRNNVWNLFRQDLVELIRRELRRKTEPLEEMSTRKIDKYFKRTSGFVDTERNPFPRIPYEISTPRPLSPAKTAAHNINKSVLRKTYLTPTRTNLSRLSQVTKAPSSHQLNSRPKSASVARFSKSVSSQKVQRFTIHGVNKTRHLSV